MITGTEAACRGVESQGAQVTRKTRNHKIALFFQI